MIELYKKYYKDARDKYQKDLNPVILSDMNAAKLAILQCCIGKFIRFKSVGSSHVAFIAEVDGNKCDAVFPYYGGQKIADILSVEIISEEDFIKSLNPVDVEDVMSTVKKYKK